MKEISLDTYEIWTIPKFSFRIYCLKIIDEKTPSSFFLSKVLICYEIETFTKEIHLNFEDDIIFRFLYITLTLNSWMSRPYCFKGNCLKVAWRINTAERISESFQPQSTYIFLNIYFFCKIAVYYKILSEAATRKFRKILSNVTSWRSAMILKKTSIKGIFRWLSKQFHNSNSFEWLLLIFGDNKQFIETPAFIKNTT